MDEAYAFTNPLRLWREITTKSLETMRLDADIGVYWSWDPRAAEAHWGDDGRVWMLVAEVFPNQVDWPGTIWANLASPEEKEIRLKSNATLRLLRIRDERGQIVEGLAPKVVRA